MKQKKRSIGFILTLLCISTLLLAACQAGTSQDRHASVSKTTRLNLLETPTISTTMTPGTPTTAPARFVGQVVNENAWIGLSTTDKRMVAFVTDGSPDHKPTYAQWFKGDITNGVIDATAPAKTGTDRFQASLASDVATGTVTFANGKSIAFTASALPDSDKIAGLYRSERTVDKKRHIAGWVVLPTGGVGTATPQATGTETPSATETTTPGAGGTTTPPVSGSLTPSATGTTAPGTLPQGGAILNEQDHTVQPAPPLTPELIASKQVDVPNLGVFKLVPCEQNLC